MRPAPDPGLPAPYGTPPAPTAARQHAPACTASTSEADWDAITPAYSGLTALCPALSAEKKNCTAPSAPYRMSHTRSETLFMMTRRLQRTQ